MNQVVTRCFFCGYVKDVCTYMCIYIFIHNIEIYNLYTSIVMMI